MTIVDNGQSVATAIGPNTVSSPTVVDESLTGDDIQDGSIGVADLAPGVGFDPTSNQTITGTWDFSNQVELSSGALSGDTISVSGGNIDFSSSPDGIRFGSEKLAVLVPFGPLSWTGSLSVGQALTAISTITGNSTGLAFLADNGGAFSADGGTIADVALLVRATGDLENRFSIARDGNVAWGNGSSSSDISLYRAMAGQLAVGGKLFVEDTIESDSLGASLRVNRGKIEVLGATADNFALETRALGDTEPRFMVTRRGTMTWGDGSNPQETNLYRSGSEVLKTDSSLVIDQDIVVNGDASIGDDPSDSIGFYGSAGATQAAVIAAPSTPSAIYSQAEAQSAVDAINSIRAALAGIGITA